MGYVKGSIDLSSTQDGVLLQQVLRSRHATHDQLWQFLQLKAEENRRRIFNWRCYGCAAWTCHETECEVLKARMGLHDQRTGAAYFAGKGDGAAFVAGKAFKQHDDPVVLHSLDLNEVHLTLIRSGELLRWKSELEILCLNELTGFGYAKDYDAVITIHSRCSRLHVRSRVRKTSEGGRSVLASAAGFRERAPSQVLSVLDASYELLSYVAGFFDRAPRRCTSAC